MFRVSNPVLEVARRVLLASEDILKRHGELSKRGPIAELTIFGETGERDEGGGGAR